MAGNVVSRRSQSGAALILMMLIVLVSATAILVTRLNNDSLHARSLGDTRNAMNAAKDALLAYAVINADLATGVMPLLPCPDIDAGGSTLDGESHTTTCGAEGQTMIGRFPWRSLSSPVLLDASGECLWYIVSGSYKNAAMTTAPMVNADSNGQLQLYSLELGSIINGVLPQDRAVAMIMAPMQPVSGQTRQGPSQPGLNCQDDFTLAAFFESDAGTGVSNAFLTGTPNSIDELIVAAGVDPLHNDKVQVLGRAELAAALYQRQDFVTGIDALGLAVAACIAEFGLGNPGGGSDRRLPWPAAVAMSDYSLDASYDDVDSGVYSGRVPDRVDDSGGATGNGIVQVLTDCDSAVVPQWQPESLTLWRNWKDHFFYIVAESFQPGASIPSACGQCLSVNGSGQYAAIVVFANRRLSAAGQVRNAPPLDADTRNDINNYLEGRNSANHPYTAGAADYEFTPAGTTFNDSLYCIDVSMSVAPC